MKVSELRTAKKIVDFEIKPRISLIDKYVICEEFKGNCLEEDNGCLYFDVLSYELGIITTIAKEYLGIELDEEEIPEMVEFLFSIPKFVEAYEDVIVTSPDYQQLMRMVDSSVNRHQETYNSVGAVLGRFFSDQNSDKENRKLTDMIEQINDLMGDLDKEKLSYLKDISTSMAKETPIG
jgi:hypothetical protein